MVEEALLVSAKSCGRMHGHAVAAAGSDPVTSARAWHEGIVEMSAYLAPVWLIADVSSQLSGAVLLVYVADLSRLICGLLCREREHDGPKGVTSGVDGAVGPDA